MIIFLNGSINSGKSTIAKLLAKAMPNTAIVEIDMLREMINWMPIDQAVPINLENAVAVIRNFTKHGISCIVPYPLSEKNYAYIVNALSDLGTPIHYVTLAPSIETALSDRGTRKLDDSERERIKHHYAIGIHAPSFGTVINNTKQTPEETTEEILKNI
jgi:energy-coupling factor transporter ATP-binding protein EcfA2